MPLFDGFMPFEFYLQSVQLAAGRSGFRFDLLTTLCRERDGAANYCV